MNNDVVVRASGKKVYCFRARNASCLIYNFLFYTGFLLRFVLVLACCRTSYKIGFIALFPRVCSFDVMNYVWHANRRAELIQRAVGRNVLAYFKCEMRANCEIWFVDTANSIFSPAMPRLSFLGRARLKHHSICGRIVCFIITTCRLY